MPPNEVLKAREARWARRLKMAAELNNEGAVVTFTLRLPFALRTSPLYRDNACKIFDALIQTFTLERIYVAAKDFCVSPDGPEGYAAVRADPIQVKKLALHVEDNYPWGLLADIDVMDHKGSPIGRSELNRQPRRCLICSREAALCVVERRHSLEEIRSRANSLFSSSIEATAIGLYHAHS